MRNRSLKKSFACALNGVAYVLATQRNMKIHTVAAVGVILLGVFLHLSRLEWGLLILTIAMVLVTEVINTALEKAIDLYTTQFHPLARIAKNVAAGAVLLAALTAIAMGILIFGARVLDLLL